MRLLIGLALIVVLGLPVHPARAAVAPQATTVLYDGALGTLPGAQGLYFDDVPSGCAVQTLNGGATDLITTVSDSNLCYAGYSNVPSTPLTLDRSAGYNLIVTVQVITETHVNPNRAGFSVIAISSDTMGIELSFWTDRVWAQSGADFTQAEGVTLPTTSLITYSLTVDNDRYTLVADGALLLSGPLRDYTGFTPPPGLPDPYETPNFVFLGDNSASARGQVRLAYVAAISPLNRLYLPFVVK